MAISREPVGIAHPTTNDGRMHDRLRPSPAENPDVLLQGAPVDEEERRAQFYAASLTAIERFAEQLDRKDRTLEKKDERLLALDREVIQLRSSVASLQRSNDDARSAYNAAQIDRQRTIDRLVDEIAELRSVRDELRESDVARGQLLEKIAALEAEIVELRATVDVERAALRAQIVEEQRVEIERAVRLIQIEIDRTRAQIAEVDALIAGIHRSIFWRVKRSVSFLRGPLRSVIRVAVRR